MSDLVSLMFLKKPISFSNIRQLFESFSADSAETIWRSELRNFVKVLFIWTHAGFTYTNATAALRQGSRSPRTHARARNHGLARAHTLKPLPTPPPSTPNLGKPIFCLEQETIFARALCTPPNCAAGRRQLKESRLGRALTI